MPVEEYYPGDFIAIVGYLRRGKTMNAVRIAYDLYLRGWNVVSNIPLTFSSSPRLTWIEQVYEIRNSVILWDEAPLTLDSRQFADNVRATQQGVLFGKRGNITIMTMPVFSTLDKRFRELTHSVYLVHQKAELYPDEWYSYITWCYYPLEGVTLYPYGSFLLPHAPYRDLFDTLFEDVILLPDPDRPENARYYARLNGSAPSRKKPTPPTVPREAKPRGTGVDHLF
jgi:hypothetical protein